MQRAAQQAQQERGQGVRRRSATPPVLANRPARRCVELLESRVLLSVTLLKDIHPGSGSWASMPAQTVDLDGPAFFTVYGEVYFVADDKVHGYELWKTDGTAGGTGLVRDVFTGPGTSGAGNLTNVNGTLFFVADAGAGGYELWKSDGTEAGTVRVKDI